MNGRRVTPFCRQTPPSLYTPRHVHATRSSFFLPLPVSGARVRVKYIIHIIIILYTPIICPTDYARIVIAYSVRYDVRYCVADVRHEFLKRHTKRISAWWARARDRLAVGRTIRVRIVSIYGCELTALCSTYYNNITLHIIYILTTTTIIIYVICQKRTKANHHIIVFVFKLQLPPITDILSTISVL